MSKILVVDDEEKMRKLLTMILTEEKYHVTTANSAALALEKFKQEAYDVVLSDIKMPGEDGLQLLSKIKSIDPYVPVILITGHADKQIAIEALRGGAFDFVEKPFSDEELLVSLKKAMEHRYLAIKYEISRQRLDLRTEKLVKLAEMVNPLTDLEGKANHLLELIDKLPKETQSVREAGKVILKMVHEMNDAIKRNRV